MSASDTRHTPLLAAAAATMDQQMMPITGEHWALALFRSSVQPHMLVLWGYFAYYLATVAFFFSATPGSLWLTALLVALIVGIALNAAALEDSGVRDYIVEAPFRCLRFFLIPFCVSSLSAISQINGDHFVLVFPSETTELVPVLVATVLVRAPLSLCCSAGRALTLARAQLPLVLGLAGACLPKGSPTPRAAAAAASAAAAAPQQRSV